MASYGKTWWGKKWLETFNGIDHENRLERGRAYAGAGRASSIKIQGNVVTAKVRGSRPTPYTVKIRFKEFDRAVQKRIGEIIEESPLILSQLLNKNLPVQIIPKLAEAKIKLFPSSWREIEASCSCPDWAMPCKHIAAVIYLICNQIDTNPFVLFEIHNCDLLNLIADYRDGRIDDVRKIVTMDDLLNPHERSKVGSLPIYLSKIPNLLSCIITVLEDNPPFYDKNFRDILEVAYKYWQSHSQGSNKSYDLPARFHDHGKTIGKRDSAAEIFLAKWSSLEKLNDFSLKLDDEYSIRLVKSGSVKFLDGKGSEQFGMVNFLKELPNALLHKFCPKIRFCHTLYQYATVLLERSAIIPQIFQNRDGAVLIRWIPALFDSTVRDIYERLWNDCPDDLVISNRSSIPAQEQVKIAVSWIIFALICDNLPAALLNRRTSDLFQMFFYGQKRNFTSFGDKEIPSSINQWLANLYLSEKSHKLYLKVKERAEGFELTPQVLLANSNLPVDLPKALRSKDAEAKLAILADIALIAKYLPEFDSIVQNSSHIKFGLEEFSSLFLNIFPALQAVGVVVVLPKSLHKILRPKISLDLKSKEKIKEDRKSFLSLDNLLEFNWQIAIGNKAVSITQFKKLLKQSRGLVKIMDNYLLLDEQEIATLLKQLEKLPDRLDSADLLQAMLAENLDGASVKLDGQLKKLVTSLSNYRSVPVPHNLNAGLRPYQERGFNWLVQNIQLSLGSILADDMGLGKTIQVIAVILYLKNQDFLTMGQSILVVAPTGLLSNWQREFEKFAPNITTGIYHGNKRELHRGCDVIITSYGLVRRDKRELSKGKWLLLVIDEAQNIKNPYSEQTKSIKSIEAVYKIAMSGTPVENRLLEYWSIFDFTNRSYLGTLEQFKRRYASAIEKLRDQESLDRFRKITAPFILRRLKSDKSIIADLPEKIENNRYCVLTPEQAALYQKVVDAALKKIERSEGIERKGLVLQLINSLKQVCNHPAQFVKKSPKVTVEQSGKMVMLDEIVSEIDDIGEKCLIFTQYVEMGNIILELIREKIGEHVVFLHGKTSRKTRDQMVHDFQNSTSNVRFFIISLKAGGTGLNLTAANHVIHYDLWWNPAVENQATDRAYRIGQKRQVMAYRFITTGSFEERIDEMIKSKKELADLTVSSGENWITEMTTAEIKNLVNLTNSAGLDGA